MLCSIHCFNSLSRVDFSPCGIETTLIKLNCLCTLHPISILRPFLCEVVMENWKDIAGYEGLYQVSDLGRVKSYLRIKSGKIRKLSKGENGYLYVSLNRNNFTSGNFVSRLVAQTFIPNPENKPEVNHKNGIKAFNWVINLEWVTRSENIRHRIDVLGVGMGEDRYQAKLTNKQVLEIRKLLADKKYTQKELGIMFGVHAPEINKINTGLRWNSIHETDKAFCRPGICPSHQLRLH